MKKPAFDSVSIYYSKFSELMEKIDHYRLYLSNDEIIRAENFYFEREQKNFILARGYLRELLGKQLIVAPESLQFAYASKFGKPYLPYHILKFNLAHNHNAVVIAISPSTELGVDIESIKREVDYASLAKKIFTSTERAYLAKVPLAQKAQLFYRGWVRKEAFVKALGVGISFDLRTVTVMQKGKNNITIEYKGEHWQIYELPMRDDNCMAVALKAKQDKISRLFF